MTVTLELPGNIKVKNQKLVGPRDEIEKLILNASTMLQTQEEVSDVNPPLLLGELQEWANENGYGSSPLSSIMQALTSRVRNHFPGKRRDYRNRWMIPLSEFKEWLEWRSR